MGSSMTSETHATHTDFTPKIKILTPDGQLNHKLWSHSLFCSDYGIKIFNTALGLCVCFDPSQGLSGGISMLTQPISLEINKGILSRWCRAKKHSIFFHSSFLRAASHNLQLHSSSLSLSLCCRCIPRSSGQDVPHICSQTLDSCSAAVKSSSTHPCSAKAAVFWINHLFRNDNA